MKALIEQESFNLAMIFGRGEVHAGRQRSMETYLQKVFSAYETELRHRMEFLSEKTGVIRREDFDEIFKD